MNIKNLFRKKTRYKYLYQCWILLILLNIFASCSLSRILLAEFHSIPKMILVFELSARARLICYTWTKSARAIPSLYSPLFSSHSYIQTYTHTHTHIQTYNTPFLIRTHIRIHWRFFCFSYSRLPRNRQKLLRDESTLCSVNAKSIKRTLRGASVPALLKRNRLRHLHFAIDEGTGRDKLAVVLNCSVISKTIWFAWSSTLSLPPKT